MLLVSPDLSNQSVTKVLEQATRRIQMSTSKAQVSDASPLPPSGFLASDLSHTHSVQFYREDAVRYSPVKFSVRYTSATRLPTSRMTASVRDSED